MNRSTFVKLWRLLKGYTLRHPKPAVTGLLGALCLLGSRVVTPLVIGTLFDRLARQETGSQLWMTWAALFGTYLVFAAANYVHTLGTTVLMAKVTADLRLDGFGRLLRSWRLPSTPGDLIVRLLDDTVEGQSVLTLTPVLLVMNLVWLIGMVAILGIIDRTFLLMALLLLPIYWLLGNGVSRRITHINNELLTERAGIADVIEEGLQTLPLTRAYDGYSHWMTRLSERIERFQKLRTRFGRWQGMAQSSAHLISDLLPATLLLVGAGMLTHGHLTFGSLVAAYGYGTQLFEPIQSLTSLMIQVASAAPALQRVEELLDTEQERQTGTELHVQEGRIDFRNVTFRYEQDGPTVLHDFTASFDRSAMNFILGPNGSGKSTIVELLLGTISPESGSILIDGMDLSTCRLSDIRRQLAVVSQRTCLIDGTVMENLLLGLSGQHPTEVTAAATELGLTELLRDLPDGCETSVGRNGQNLSGGQAQRVALARALLKDAPILIVDEGTANLDVASEIRTYRLLADLVGEKTVLVITHRLPTVECPRRYVWLTDPCCVEEEAAHAQGY